MNAGNDQISDKTAPPSKRGMRWWIPALIIAVATANITRLQTMPDLDALPKRFWSLLSVFATVPFLLVWWLFLSRLRWRVRLLGVVLVAAGVGVLEKLVRLDGSLGTGQPILVWSWTPRKTGDVPASAPVSAESPGPALEGELDYPGYLGPNRSGCMAGARLESDWIAHPPQQLWRHAVGLGWSGFAVSGGRAVTQEQRGENELVICYSLKSGSLLWAHTNQLRFSDPMGGDGPRATPTIADNRVFTLGATGILDCLSLGTGKLIWTHDILKENSVPNTPFGKTSSPLRVDDLVVVTGGMKDKGTLLAYRSADGAPAWQTGGDQASFTSPTVATLCGQRQILSVNAANVGGYDAKDGHPLWQYAWGSDKWPKCAQPVVLEEDRILLSASFQNPTTLLQVTRGSDGKFSVNEIWKNHNLKAAYNNIVARDGYAYGLDDGILVCLDLATGERKWKDGRYGKGQVLLAGGLLLVQTEPGPITLVEASPAGFHELANIPALHAKTWNTPALAGQYLIVRNDQEAACYKLSQHAAF
ncbi:MAG TPA: PQQ-binding-like beta-propeller repeat protein [Verrucomicrobiae bacterium]|nr:PQQ-binding-like beta-propeller repeat protein [Verrucomicrobiae bacterium]